MAPHPWTATHRTPAYRVDFWPAPDPHLAAAGSFDPGTDVRLLELRGNWAYVDRPSGWSAWADARLLVPAQPPPPAPIVSGGATVVIAEVGPERVQVVKAIRDALGVELAHAKDLADAAPGSVLNLADAASAHSLELELRAHGAKVERR